MKPSSSRVIRQARGAGSWFPSDRDTLRTMVDGFIEAAKPAAMGGRIAGAIAPHAGFMYSGGVAGFVFRALKNNAEAGHRPELVVIIGACHRTAFTGVALMDGNAIETPLGEAELDAAAAAEMVKDRSRIFFDYSPHRGEHSAENQIPFAQRALPGTKLVVGLTGDLDPATIRDLVSALAELAEKQRTVVVASSDMLHHPDYKLVGRTDRETLAKVEAMDHAAILKQWNGSRQTFCGIAPVISAMKFAETQGCKRGTVLHYRNSGDDFPESRGEWVVGYGAVVFAVP